MANTYYGYAQREAAEQVDWSGVARKFTTMLDDEVKAKEEREASLDKANTDLATLLSTAPSSENKELHNWILDYGNNASNYSLMLHRSVQNGNMSRKQYTQAMNNLTAGTNQALAVANKYNQYFIDQEKERKEGTLPAERLFTGALIQGFADFNNTALYIDPITMKVSQGKTVTENIDGHDVRTLSSNTGDFRPVNQLLSWMGETYSKFDMTGAIDNIAGNMAVSYQDLNDTDPRISGEDNVRLNENYDTAMSNYIASYLEDPREVASILADHAGMAPNKKPWQFTTDVAKTGTNMIYLSPNNNGGYSIDLDTPKGRELQKQAGKVLEAAVDVKLPRKITMAETKEPGWTWNKATSEEIKGSRNVEAMLNMAYGTQAQFDAAVGHFKAVDTSITNIEKTADGKGYNVTKTVDGETSSSFVPWHQNPDTLLDGSSQLIGADTHLEKGLAYMLGTNSEGFNTLYTQQAGDSPRIREQGSFETPANVPKVINYNEIEIKTGEWKKKLNAAGKEVDTETPVTAKPLEILQNAIGVGDDVRLKDRDINRLDDIRIGITKVVKGLNIGSLNDTNAVVTVIDDDKQNDAERDLESYLTGDNYDWAVGGASSIEIYYPELMSGPIFIPDQGSSKSNATKTASLIDDVYGTLVKAANEGRRLAPNDFSFIRNDNQINAYNKDVYDWARANDTFVDFSGDKFEWNDGLGLTYDTKQSGASLPADVKKVRVNGKEVLLRELDNGKFEQVEIVDLNENVNSEGSMSKYNTPGSPVTTNVVTIETIKEKLGDRYVAERDAMEIKYPITDPKADYADAAAYEKFIDEQMILIAKDIGIAVN
tara:strand:- start:192 stop:2672 length:2481 start_codon:yes stop_codon:yes gene_type:complete